MKKIAFVFSLIIVLAMSVVTVSAISGDGTEETPFIIENQGELELVTDFPDCHFKLANDIKLEGIWVPLCKETSSGYFSGVFDGAGYTISNLLTDKSEGGLFKDNKGTIKNVNIIIADAGMTGSAAIADDNTATGVISNCTVKGNILDGYNDYIGGICADNYGTVKECKFEGSIKNARVIGSVGGICGYNGGSVVRCKFDGDIENSNSGSIGGICGSNGSDIAQCVALADISGKHYTGGICGFNDEKITECYFIGAANSSSSYKGGIAGYCSGTVNVKAVVTDCYAVPTFDSSGYGIAYSYSYSTITTSYYDKTISGLSDTSYGTPKSTAAMKMKQTYATNWDFDTVWGIDKNINDGYPYLLWEYQSVEAEAPYTLNSIAIKDLSGNELEEIPDSDFYFEINVTKNDNSKDTDSLIIAVYDENGILTDVKYMSGVYYQNQTMTFGAAINQQSKKIGNIKSFVWNSISGVKPLSNSLEFIK